MSRLRRLLLTAAAAVVGLVVGFCAGVASVVVKPDEASLAEYGPLPHHVPSHEGGPSFRFAMAHDVIHERYPRHGSAYHHERERILREKLATLPADSPSALALNDDLALALDRLGRSPEAVILMGDNLARQQASGAGSVVTAATRARLGTFLLHANFTGAAAGDADARGRFGEGVEHVRRAIETNPEGYFHRERWRLALAEFHVAAMDRPILLRTFDFLGNHLDRPIEKTLERGADRERLDYGRPYSEPFARDGLHRMPTFFRAGEPIDGPARWKEASPLRECVTKVGAEDGWGNGPGPSLRNEVAFDEPCLGIVELWKQAGADPHLALALGETLLRVGQRYVAWTAFERAALLAERFWPDRESQRFLREHCRTRQTQIEQTLSQQAPTSQQVSPPPVEGTVEGLRPAFAKELAFGEGYQEARQKYEQEKIAVGVPISDEHFFDDFDAGRPPIASPSGSEERYASLSEWNVAKHATWERVKGGLAWGAFAAGLAALGASLVSRWYARRGREVESPEASGEA